MADIFDEVGKTIGSIIFIVVVFFWFLPAEFLPLLGVGGNEMWSIFSYGSYILGILLIIAVILHLFRR